MAQSKIELLFVERFAESLLANSDMNQSGDWFYNYKTKEDLDPPATETIISEPGREDVSNVVVMTAL